MFTAIDHIIIGVNNLAQATAHFQDKLGLIASGGGVHPSGGTANQIIVIGDTYLELITLQKPDEAQPSMRQRLAKGDGFINFVLASDDINADSRSIEQKNIAVIGPLAGSLQSADQRTRGWLRTDIERPDMAQRYPFIIQHDSTGEERRFRLAGWQNPPEHPLGAIGVLSVAIAVQDITEALATYQHIYSIQPLALPTTSHTHSWNVTGATFNLGAGKQHFELISPQPNKNRRDTDLLPETKTLMDHLNRYGDSLYSMTLLVKDLTFACHFLDTHAIPYKQYDKTIWIDPLNTCGAAIILQQENQ